MLSAETRLADLLSQYPSLMDFLAFYSPKYELLRNPVLRRTLGKVVTLRQVAEVGGVELDKLISDLEAEIARLEGQPASKEEILKEIILDLHRGVPVEQLKSRFSSLVSQIDGSELAALEQKIIAEGVPEEEVKRLCDLHVDVFRESLDEQKLPQLPSDHPLQTYLEENKHAKELAGSLMSLLDKRPFPYDELKGQLENFSQIDKHYLRKENQLFPLLEAKGLSGPSSVMWAIHDDIRSLIKQTKSLLEEKAEPGKVISAIKQLVKMTDEMIYKEEQILFPTSLDVLTEDDWRRVREGEAELGYAWIEPPPAVEAEPPKSQQVPTSDNTFPLDTGRLSLEQINLVLTNLPIDITFVDENDTVCYYSEGRERIFPRTPAAIGRKVHNCHPPSSVHVVEEILTAFREGKQDVAQFWLELNGRFILIRYFALRQGGEYKGVLEVTQDLTELRKLQGERRILDWRMQDL